MRSTFIAGLMGMAVLIPGAAVSQRVVGEPMGAMPSLPLRPPVSAAHPMPQQAVHAEGQPGGVWTAHASRPDLWHGNPMPPGNWHGNPPRPGGWSWGGRGYWGGAYRAPVRGFFLPSFWQSPTYVIGNWDGYGLAAPGRGRSWVRYYDDAVLIDRRGLIYDSVRDLDWDRYDHGRVPEYAGDVPDDLSLSEDRYGAGYDYRDDAPPFDDYGDRYARQGEHWQSSYRGYYSGGYRDGSVIISPPGSVTTIVIQSQPVVTTTTYYEDVVAPVARKAWRPRAVAKPKARYRAPVRQRCTCGS